MFRTFNDVIIPDKKREDDEEDTSKLYVCDFCNEGWSSETEVELHRVYAHPSKVNKLLRSNEHVCKICVSEFSSKDCLVRHIKSDHLLSSKTAIRVEREIFICDTCGDVFFNKLLLTHHIVHTHSPKNKSSNKSIKCPTCLKNIYLNNCWYHFRMHRLQSTSCCRICCKKIKDRHRLAEHLKTHPLVLKCEQCGYQTKKGDLFKYHIETVHKKPDKEVDTTLDCSVYFMPMVESDKWNVRNLMGWRGVKLTNGFRICVLCKEICTDIGSMERHIILDHMDRETTTAGHYCSCGMVFTSQVLLKYHKFKEEHCDVPTYEIVI